MILYFAFIHVIIGAGSLSPDSSMKRQCYNLLPTSYFRRLNRSKIKDSFVSSEIQRAALITELWDVVAHRQSTQEIHLLKSYVLFVQQMASMIILRYQQRSVPSYLPECIAKFTEKILNYIQSSIQW